MTSKQQSTKRTRAEEFVSATNPDFSRLDKIIPISEDRGFTAQFIKPRDAPHTRGDDSGNMLCANKENTQNLQALSKVQFLDKFSQEFEFNFMLHTPNTKKGSKTPT